MHDNKSLTLAGSNQLMAFCQYEEEMSLTALA